MDNIVQRIDELIKKLNQDFIDSVKSPDKEYYQKRLELMNQIKGKTIWQ